MSDHTRVASHDGEPDERNHVQNLLQGKSQKQISGLVTLTNHKETLIRKRNQTLNFLAISAARHLMRLRKVEVEEILPCPNPSRPTSTLHIP